MNDTDETTPTSASDTDANRQADDAPVEAGTSASRGGKTAAQRAAAARKRARRLARMRPAGDVANDLMERFPNTFFKDARARQPLTVGIHVQLAEAVGDDFHKLELQRFLNNYAHSLGYLHSVADKRPRIDLTGSPTDEVITDDMAADARKEIDAIQEKRAARGDGPKRGNPKPKAKPGGAPRGGGREAIAPKRGTGYLGAGRKRKAAAPVPGSAEELREAALQQRNQRTATIIEKKRRVPPAIPNTLLGQKLADAGLGPSDAPRKKLRLGKKNDPSDAK